jgi:hypothetical protein
MDAHRLAEERSVAYHRVVAEKLRRDPRVLERARQRVADWLRSPVGPPRYARSWREVLERDVESVAAFLVERSDRADELRQSSPFAGALDASKRWRIWRETRGLAADQP